MSERSWVDPDRYPYSKWLLGRWEHATLERLVNDGRIENPERSARLTLENLVRLGWAELVRDAYVPLAPAYEAIGLTEDEARERGLGA